MEEYYTRILKHVDYNYELTLAVFGNIINMPDTVTSIYFTDIKMPSNATLIDADDDGDGGVVAWVDPSDNTKMYVSTQNNGIKIEAHESSTRIFTYCENLTSLDVSKWDTSKVIKIYEMFSNCSSLTSLDLSSWNTNNVIVMRDMFNGCSSLTTIKVGDKFKWITTLSGLGLSGTWKDETGKQYTSASTFPSNVAHTYTKVS